MEKLIILILIIFNELFLQTFFDTWQKIERKKINHFVETLFGFMLVIVAIMYLLADIPANLQYFSFGYYLCCRFMFYDILYNVMNNNSTWYIGKTALTDKILSRLNIPQVFIMYARVLVFMFGTYFIFGKYSDYWATIGKINIEGDKLGYFLTSTMIFIFILFAYNNYFNNKKT